MNHINIQQKTNKTVQHNEIGSNIDPNVIPNDSKVFLGKGTKSLSPLFCNILESFHYNWKEASKLKNQHEKRSLRHGIFQRMYTEWKSNKTGDVFLSSSVAQDRHVAELSEDEVVKLLPKKVDSYFRKMTKVHFHGVSFPDFVEGKIEGSEKEIIDCIPLHLPDKFIGSDMSKNVSITHKFLYNKMMTLKQDGGDAEKFRNGRNCYVDGALYNKLNPDVKVLDIKDIGEFNIEFDMVGAKVNKTHVKVHLADTTMGLFKESSAIISKLRYMKGNARQYHLSSNASQYMMSFSETMGTKLPYKSNETFDSLPPKSLTLEKVGKLVDEAVQHKFQNIWNKSRNLEKAAGNSLIGSEAAHSLDVSVNLANAAHFDNGDIGYGVGIWFSENHKFLDKWYFLLPSCTINGSKGVAIKLHHGLMIQWNGTEVKHCSMDPGDVGDNTLFGLFLGPKSHFNKKESSSKSVTKRPQEGVSLNCWSNQLFFNRSPLNFFRLHNIVQINELHSFHIGNRLLMKNNILSTNFPIITMSF
jgi:hypothetical protein